jgi:hypothetical protein
MPMHLWGMLGGSAIFIWWLAWGWHGSWKVVDRGVVPRMGPMGLMGLMGRRPCNRSRPRRRPRPRWYDVWFRPAVIVGRASFWGQLNDPEPAQLSRTRTIAKLTALLVPGREGRRRKGVGRIHRRRWQIGRGDRVPNRRASAFGGASRLPPFGLRWQRRLRSRFRLL